MYNNNTVHAPAVSVRGVTGNSYQFQVFEWGTRFKSISAVYVIIRQKLSGHYAILYTGQTSDLSNRFDAHNKQACFDRHCKTHIGVMPESSEAKRLAVEADIIAAHHPVCNH